jgi:hypothetical protein
MKDIYEGVKKVVIWLGPAENDSDIAMDMVKYLAKCPIHPVGNEQAIHPRFFGPPGKPFTDQNWEALK